MDDEARLAWTIKLLEADEASDVEACREALKNGAMVDTETDDPVLFRLLRHHDAELVRMALTVGGDPNLTRHGKTPLYWARDVEVARVLIEAGASVAGERPENGYTSVHRAAEDGHAELLQLLIDRANGAAAFSLCDYIARTPLAAAAYAGQLETVQILIEAGADLNAACDEQIGDPPIKRAASNGHLQVVKALLDAGADPLATGWMQLDALYHARQRGDAAMQTVLEWAIARRGHPERLEKDY